MKQILNAAGITVPEQVTAEKCKGDFLVCGGIEHRRWMAERALSGWQQSPFLKDGKNHETRCLAATLRHHARHWRRKGKGWVVSEKAPYP